MSDGGVLLLMKVVREEIAKGWDAVWKIILGALESALDPRQSIQETLSSIQGYLGDVWESLKGLNLRGAHRSILQAKSTGFRLVDSVGLYLYLGFLAVPTFIGSLLSPVGAAAGLAIGQKLNSVASLLITTGDSLYKAALAALDFADLRKLFDKAVQLYRKWGGVGNPSAEIILTLMDEEEQNEAGNKAQAVNQVGFEGSIMAVIAFIGTWIRKIWQRLSELLKKLPRVSKLWDGMKRLFVPKKLPWNSWHNLPKVVENGKEYAKIGDRLYTGHAVDRMLPSGLGRPAGGDGAGRSISPTFVEDVIQHGTKHDRVVDGVLRTTHTSGTVQVVTEQGGRIVVTVNPFSGG